MDPFAKESRRQSYLKKDSITYLVKAGECVKWDDVVANNAKTAGSRLVWRPPKDFITAVNGNIHSDSRGLFTKYLGHKVVFRNKMNAPLRIKATVPVGKIDDPTSIYSRPIIEDINIESSGTKKEQSRGKGKRMKVYTRSTDRGEINVTEKNLFSGDANLYTLFTEVVPGDNSATPSYKAKGFVLLDYIPILPNENQYAGAAFKEDLIVCEIVITVRYIVSRLVASDDAKLVDNVLQFYKGKLANLAAIFHVDYDSFVNLTGIERGPMMRKLDRSPYPYVGLLHRQDRIILFWFDSNYQAVKPATVRAYHEGGVRVVLPGLSYGSGEIKTSEFAYDSEVKGWVLYSGNEPVIKVMEGFSMADDVKFVSSLSPIVVYSNALNESPRGLICNYGPDMAYALTWQQIAQGLSVVLKVLPLVLQIGGILFG